MGGNAFQDLDCPRMSHEQYYILRDRCIALLKEKFYTHVISPPEAPSKTDHGDIDLLVEGPTHQFSAKDLSAALGAVANTKTGVTTSFAVPLPSKSNGEAKSEQGEGVETFAQIDVHVCSPGNLEWELFLQSYGDLMQILGVMNRAIGLTANDKGLHIRIKEIEPYDRKKSMLFLTKSPREAMGFLGLDPEIYFAEISNQTGAEQTEKEETEGKEVNIEKGFQTNEQIYTWCAAGRFYTLPTRHSETETANDRIRYRKRLMFTTCVNTFYPTNPQLFSSRPSWTREQVLLEGLRYFHSAKPLYDEAMATHKQVVWEHEVLTAVKSVIPVVDEKLGEVMRGLKRFVRYDKNGKPALCSSSSQEEISEKPQWMAAITSEAKKQELLDWVSENWSEVRTREKDRMAAAKEARTVGKAERVGEGHDATN